MTEPFSQNLTRCSQCGLPFGRGGIRRAGGGETLHFCCLGCSFTHAIIGDTGEQGAAGLFLFRLGFAAFLSMNIMILSWVSYDRLWITFGLDPGTRPYLDKLQFVLATPIMILLGYPYLKNGLRELPSGNISIDALIAIGSWTAYLVSSYEALTGGSAIYFDSGTMVLVLVTFGRYLEATAKVKTTHALSRLLTFQPDVARVVRDGSEFTVSTDTVLPGEFVRILPGERIPLDGIVRRGLTTVDESILTGEPMPVSKSTGNSVLAASINIDGAIDIESTALRAETVHARVVRFMEEAQQSRSPIQQSVDRIAGIFIPSIVITAVLTTLVWLLFAPPASAFMYGLTVLVVACPCALGLGTPMAAAIGIGRAAEEGVLVRSTEVIERLTRTTQIAFDKTGTLTRGNLSVMGFHCYGEEKTFLDLLGSLEKQSGHPIGRSIAQFANEHGRADLPVREIRIIPGAGVSGSLLVNESWTDVYSGTRRFMDEMHQVCPDDIDKHLLEAGPSSDLVRTVVYAGWGGAVRGVLLLGDTLRDSAAYTVSAMDERAFATMLISGDTSVATEAIGVLVGISHVESGLSPGEKVNVLRSRRSFGPVIMVGDGINDGPSLAAAHVGITLGCATDLAKEHADVIILGDHLEKIPWLIDYAHRVVRTIRWNLFWAFFYNGIGVLLAMAGLLQPVVAAIAMVMSSVVIIINSRLLRRPEIS